IAALAWRISGRAWTGPAALLLLFFIAPVSPFPWAPRPVVFGTGLGWLSPTHTLGAAVFAALVLALAGVFGCAPGSPVRWERWLLVSILTVVAACSKSTFLVVLGGGFALVVVVEAVLRRRAHRSGAIGLVLVAGVFVATQILFFHGKAHGLTFDPMANLLSFPIARETGLDELPAAGAAPRRSCASSCSCSPASRRRCRWRDW
ncbi:hypothetical protein, partial [Planomonospora algeriensis]